MFGDHLNQFFILTNFEQQENKNNYFIGYQPHKYINMEQNNGDGGGCVGGPGDSCSSIDRTKLIVNYLPQFTTEEDLTQIFSQVGNVENVKIMRDYKTGYGYGFGFVKYFKEEDACKAIQVFNGYNFRNKRLKVSFSRPPGSDMKDSNLYITNLPRNITEQEVENLFKEYGEIIQKTVLKDKYTGLPRGVAFVRYAKGEEAQAAIANLDGKIFDNAMLPLSVRVAEDHGRQKAQYLDAWSPVNGGGGGGVRGFANLRTTSFIPFRNLIPPVPSMSRPPSSSNKFTRFPTYINPEVYMRRFGAGDSTYPNNQYFY